MLRYDTRACVELVCDSARSAKATSRFAREIEVISRWLSTALPPEFSDEKLFMATYGQDARRLLIVQEIARSVELLKDKVEKWKRKSLAERAATAKSCEEFARLAFEDIQRNVTALVNIEASARVSRNIRTRTAHERYHAAYAPIFFMCARVALMQRRPCTSQTSGAASTPKRKVSGGSSIQRGRYPARVFAPSRWLLMRAHLASCFCSFANAGFV